MFGGEIQKFVDGIKKLWMEEEEKIQESEECGSRRQLLCIGPQVRVSQSVRQPRSNSRLPNPDAVPLSSPSSLPRPSPRATALIARELTIRLPFRQVGCYGEVPVVCRC